MAKVKPAEHAKEILDFVDGNRLTAGCAALPLHFLQRRDDPAVE
jgi:hypothetical protein